MANQTVNLTADIPLCSGGIFDIFGESALAVPAKIMIECDDDREGEALTYEQAFCRSIAVSRILAGKGIKRGDKVGLFFPNHLDFLPAFFAVTALGATVVPINPLLKGEEISHILNDSQAVALISYFDLVASVLDDVVGIKTLKTMLWLSAAVDPEAPQIKMPEGSQIDIVSLSQAQLDAATQAVINDLGIASGAHKNLDSLYSKLRGGNAAQTLDAQKELGLIVYTSGTTGKPKGAMLTFSNLQFAIKTYPERLALTADDVLLAVLPLCHLYGLLVVLLGTIVQRASMVVVRDFSATRVLDLIDKKKVTATPMVPTMYQLISLELEKGPRQFLSWRLGMCGGAAMPPDLHKKVEKQLGLQILEGWSLTEASVITTLNPIGKCKYGSVGPTFPGIELAAFDSHGDKLPPGEAHVGELRMKGPNVMAGYYNNKQASDEAVKDGWLHTGDLGYLDDEGYTYVVGRSKEMIIRGGMNIYPREVEAVILRMPEVKDVAVLGVPCQFMGERVKACVVLRDGKELSEEDVKAFCSGVMAEYKVPRVVQFMDAIPKNSTGKALKRLLV